MDPEFIRFIEETRKDREENREDHKEIFKEVRSVGERMELYSLSQGNTLGKHTEKLAGHDKEIGRIWKVIIWPTGIGSTIAAGYILYLMTR